MNLQEAFNLIWERAKDKTKATVPGQARCYYRSPNGNRCFIGALIPDDRYKADFENIPLWEIKSRLKDILEPEEIKLGELQSIHDSCDVDAWKHYLCEFARMNELTIPV